VPHTSRYGVPVAIRELFARNAGNNENRERFGRGAKAVGLRGIYDGVALCCAISLALRLPEERWDCAGYRGDVLLRQGMQ
jgi:hypothetical protein